MNSACLSKQYSVTNSSPSMLRIASLSRSASIAEFMEFEEIITPWEREILMFNV